jgi:hypothetical protein
MIRSRTACCPWVSSPASVVVQTTSGAKKRSNSVHGVWRLASCAAASAGGSAIWFLRRAGRGVTTAPAVWVLRP